MAGGQLTGKKRRPWYQSRLAAAVTAVLAIAFVAVGCLVYALHQPAGIGLVRLQWWAGSTAEAKREICGQPAGLYRMALNWDMLVLVPGYAIGLALACFLGTWVFWMPRSRTWARTGMVAVVVAVVGNIAQDLLLRSALGDGLRGTVIPDLAEALSLVTFSALLAAAAVAIVAIAVTLTRAMLGRQAQRHWEEAWDDCSGDAVCPAIPPPVIEQDAGKTTPPLAGQGWWRNLSTGSHARWAQGFASPSDRPGDHSGVCVSGGGIRSAAVALGALQALRDKKVLCECQYLVSVSGGGYTAGGLQLAMAQKNPERASQPALRDAFDRGSPEEDYLRRHSSYIAANLSQWLVALGVLLRGVLSSLIIIGLTVTTLGVAIGEFYRAVPIADGGNLAQLQPGLAGPSYPPIPPGVWLAIAGSGGLTVLAYLTRLLEAWPDRVRRARQAALALLAVTLLLFLIGAGLPALLWASGWLTWWQGFSRLRTAWVGSLTILTTYLGAVAAILWRKRVTLTRDAKAVTGAARKPPVNQILPNSMIQLILMWISLAFLIAVALVLCGQVATSGLVHSKWVLVPVGALAFLAVTLDQTSLSMHYFYQRRLARAFAVRRGTRDGMDVAEPYDDVEVASLSRCARPYRDFPEVTFAATANISDQGRTPSGRPAVPFTFAHDYIGGPATGWVRTQFLEKVAGRYIGQDLTVQAAMAISGAAFASAMGSQTRFYEVFLAIANARLGAWLPNPAFVAFKWENREDWTIPGLPSRRRLSYFAREILGIHPSAGRMLLVTDGGHYDNLGLMELLRRRCKVIYCIDASDASQPLVNALSGAIALAREELGVEITPAEEAFDLVPGSGEQFKPATSFAALNLLLAKRQVMIADVTYPAVAQSPGHDGAASGSHEEAHGQIVFAQAVLTSDTPYQLLDFPQVNPGFPHDSTGDQFFNAAQFDSYQELGYLIGQVAVDRLFEVNTGLSRLGRSNRTPY